MTSTLLNPHGLPRFAVPQPKAQNDKVLCHLLTGRSITPLEAFGLYGIFRLAARIHVLKGRGHKIETLTKRDVNGKAYAEYRLRLTGRNGERRAAA
jgi:hypothetical protein